MLYDNWKYESDPVRDHILKSAQLIADTGWCQHQGHRKTIFGNDQYCMVGAMISSDPMVAQSSRLFEQSSQRILKHLKKKYNYNLLVITFWNDHVAKSKKQVVAEMREAAYVKETV